MKILPGRGGSHVSPQKPKPFKAGDTVAVNYNSFGELYVGKVAAFDSVKGTFDINYNDGTNQVGVPAALVTQENENMNLVDTSCSLCRSTYEYEDRTAWRCDICLVFFHPECNGVARLPEPRETNGLIHWYPDLGDAPFYCERCAPLSAEFEAGGDKGVARVEAAVAEYGCALCPNKGPSHGLFFRVPPELGCPEPWIHATCAQYTDGLWMDWHSNHASSRGSSSQDNSSSSNSYSASGGKLAGSTGVSMGGATVRGWEEAAHALAGCSALLRCQVCRKVDGCAKMCPVTSFDTFHETPLSSSSSSSSSGAAAGSDSRPKPKAGVAKGEEAAYSFATDAVWRDLTNRDVPRDAKSDARERKRAYVTGAVQALLDGGCCHAFHISCAQAHGCHGKMYPEDIYSDHAHDPKRSFFLCDSHSRKRNLLHYALTGLGSNTAKTDSIIATCAAEPVPPPEGSIEWFCPPDQLMSVNPRMAWIAALAASSSSSSSSSSSAAAVVEDDIASASLFKHGNESALPDYGAPSAVCSASNVGALSDTAAAFPRYGSALSDGAAPSSTDEEKPQAGKKRRRGEQESLADGGAPAPAKTRSVVAGEGVDAADKGGTPAAESVSETPKPAAAPTQVATAAPPPRSLPPPPSPVLTINPSTLPRDVVHMWHSAGKPSSLAVKLQGALNSDNNGSASAVQASSDAAATDGNFLSRVTHRYAQHKALSSSLEQAAGGVKGAALSNDEREQLTSAAHFPEAQAIDAVLERLTMALRSNPYLPRLRPVVLPQIASIAVSLMTQHGLPAAVDGASEFVSLLAGRLSQPSTVDEMVAGIQLPLTLVWPAWQQFRFRYTIAAQCYI